MEKRNFTKVSLANVAILVTLSLILCSCAGTSAGRTVTETQTGSYSAPPPVSTDPDEAKYNALLGVAAMKNGDWDTAVKFLEKSVDKSPGYQKSQYQEMLGRIYGGRGAERIQQGYTSSGISDLEKALSLVNDREYQIQGREALGLVYGQRGISFVQNGDYSPKNLKSAIRDLETGITYVQDSDTRAKFNQILALLYTLL
ncbi:MAG: hypothetical protein V2I97_24960 [Desulfococcaceae bacterium]|jgi:tetratricopeptide (TPR) repeat protein|nr:hypothetical protein [Desulfococcaceae bacterium]